MHAPARRSHEAAWWCLLAAAAAHFSLVYSFAGSPFLRLSEYESGRAMLPYQARVLMAWVFHATVHREPLLRLASHLPVQLQDPYALVQAFVNFVAMVLALAATRLSIRSLVPSSGYARWSSLVLLPMVYTNLLLAYGLRYTLPYDVPSLAFFSIGIAAILNRRWWMFYPVFVLGTLNRETFCFVSLIFLLWQIYGEPAEQRRPVRIALHLAAQIAIWVGIKAWLHLHFVGNTTEGNGTGLFRLQLQHNVHYLLNPAQYPLFVSLFGFLWIPLLLGRRFIRNAGIERICLVVIPAWIAVMLLVGVIVEIRVFNELASLLAIVAALEAWHLWFEPLWRLRPATTTVQVQA